MQTTPKNTYPKQCPLGINGISIPVDEVKKCQPLSQDISELTTYLADLEILTAETDDCLKAGSISRFISPAVLMAKLILKRTIEYEKTIYGIAVLSICIPIVSTLLIPAVQADTCTDTINYANANFQDMRKIALDYQSRLACYETVTDGLGNVIKCATAKKTGGAS